MTQDFFNGAKNGTTTIKCDKVVIQARGKCIFPINPNSWIQPKYGFNDMKHASSSSRKRQQKLVAITINDTNNNQAQLISWQACRAKRISFLIWEREKK